MSGQDEHFVKHREVPRIERDHDAAVVAGEEQLARIGQPLVAGLVRRERIVPER
jgi:hypothetical protein